MVLNVIHLKNRTDRWEAFVNGAKDQNIEFKVWDGIVDTQVPFRGISKAHRQIVRDAKEKGFPSVTICEDDIEWFGKGAWNYYVENIPEKYHLYFGMVYEGNIDENNRVTGAISGLTLYTVHECFYDFFLSVKDLNHLDRELSKYSEKFIYKVCPEFVAYQSDGWSDNKKQHGEYEKYLVGRKIYKPKS